MFKFNHNKVGTKVKSSLDLKNIINPFLTRDLLNIALKVYTKNGWCPKYKETFKSLTVSKETA